MFAVSSNDITAIIVALAALATAIGTSFVNIMAARDVKRKVEENTEITLEVKEKTAVIATEVNSAASKSKGIIESLEIQNGMLRDMVSKLETAAALVAQAQAAAGRATPLGETPETDKTLEGIEENTEATAKNIAKTDIKVSEALK